MTARFRPRISSDFKPVFRVAAGYSASCRVSKDSGVKVARAIQKWNIISSAGEGERMRERERARRVKRGIEKEDERVRGAVREGQKERAREKDR